VGRDSGGALRGRFNGAARRAAGFDDAELAALAAHSARADQEPEGEGRA
jgi:uncharacterized ferritin-like protein (DUF455 family)